MAPREESSTADPLEYLGTLMGSETSYARQRAWIKNSEIGAVGGAYSEVQAQDEQRRTV